MGWPNRLYAATKTLGVYYTANFIDPDTQPTWSAVNGGLPATDVRQFALDPFNPAGKQYLLLETARTLYRRDNGGNWAAILTDAQADTLFSTVGVISFFCADVTLAGRLWVAYLEQLPGGNGSNAWAAYSDDYGATWTATTRVTDDNLDYVGAVGGIQASGDNVWVGVFRQSGAGMRCSTNKGSTWPAEGTGAQFVVHNPLLPTLVYTSHFANDNLYSVSNTGTSTLLDGAGIGQYDQMWFAAATANHQRAIIDGKVYVTADGWTTKNTPSAIAPVPISIAPWAGADEDNIIVGLVLDTDPYGGLQPHVIGVLYGEDDTTAVGIAGANCSTDPYTDSIPMTCGGAAIGGIVAVQETPSESPAPPPDATITPPGGTVITLGGTANVNAVSMPGYTGTALGEPLPGDRSAFMVDTDAHAALHASDIRAAEPTMHNPTPVGNAGKAPVSDGTKYVATDVLTPAEHTAIGDGSPHHAAVTLAASADAILDLTGQAISLETETANTVLAGPTSGAAAAPDFRALANADLPDPLAFKSAASALTIASGAVTATQNLHTITSESGTTDDLATITAAADRTLLLLQATATHTITVKHGTGNISLNGAADFELTGNKALLLFWDGTKWVDLGAGGGGGAALTVKEIDGTPSVASVSEMRVTNGTLTDVGSGVVQLDFGSAATDGAAIHDNEAGEIHVITSKATPVAADELLIEDSAASWAKKRVAISSLPSGGGAPTDAEYITSAAHASLSAEVIIPGMAGNPDRKPASPNTEDDEFDSSTLAEKWTKTSTAANDDVDTTWPSCAYANFTGDHGYNLSQAYAPAGAFSLTACFYHAMQANYQGCHIFVYDDDESDGIRATIEGGGGNNATLSTKDGGSWNYGRSSVDLGGKWNKHYVHLQRGASNDWSVWYSSDGRSFFRIGTYSKTFTIHHFELEIGQGGATIPVRAGIDWVRRDWITL